MATNKGNSDRKFYPLKGSIYYARFFEADEMYGKYSVAVGNLSDQNAKALASLGITVKEDPKGVMGKYINFRSKFPFKVYDAEENEWVKSNWIGNGSKGTFTFFAQEIFKPRKMTMARCTKVVITDYIPYVKEQVEVAKEEVEDLDSVIAANDNKKSSKKPAVDFEDA